MCDFTEVITDLGEAHWLRYPAHQTPEHCNEIDCKADRDIDDLFRSNDDNDIEVVTPSR